jgi:prevent-host-death family protein
MAEAAGASKVREELTVEQARRSFGDLINRASLQGKRFLLTRRGKRLVAIVSIEDLHKLEQADRLETAMVGG